MWQNVAAKGIICTPQKQLYTCASLLNLTVTEMDACDTVQQTKTGDVQNSASEMFITPPNTTKTLPHTGVSQLSCVVLTRASCSYAWHSDFWLCDDSPHLYCVLIDVHETPWPTDFLLARSPQGGAQRLWR